MIVNFYLSLSLKSHLRILCFSNFLQRIISYGIDEKMEQSVVNRAKRINIFYYLILFAMLCFHCPICLPYRREMLELVADNRYTWDWLPADLISWFHPEKSRTEQHPGADHLTAHFLTAYLFNCG